MEELAFLKEYIIPAVLGICLCVGYVIKHSLSFIPNKYIPGLMLILGTVISCCMSAKSGINEVVILSGMASGLASTGLHELFRNFLSKDEEDGKNG